MPNDKGFGTRPYNVGGEWGRVSGGGAIGEGGHVPLPERSEVGVCQTSMQTLGWSAEIASRRPLKAVFSRDVLLVPYTLLHT